MIISNILKYRFSTLMRYTFLSAAMMLGLDLIGNFDAPWYATVAFAMLIGLLLGIYRIYVGFDFLKPAPGLFRVIAKIIIIQIIIYLSATILQFFIVYFEQIEAGIQFKELLVSKSRLTLYYKAQIFSFLFYFFMELEAILGPQFLRDYVTGKYNHPTKEHRIILFMDLKDSTALTEKMGDVKYYEFINQTYSLLNKPIITTKAEILKYVGDEVIVSWKYKDGIALDNCLRFFTEYQKLLDQHEGMFIKKYGHAPEFKAGLHHGTIVAAYLGGIKKQLDFSGDVMNTTARIMDQAKNSDFDIILSDEIFYALNYEKYNSKKIPSVLLKGKENKMNLTGLVAQTALKTS